LKRITTILIGLTLLASCDCLRQATGTVTDKTSGRPVQFAQVALLGSNNSTTTDSLGNFQLGIINSGLQCYCKPKNEVTVSAPLYLTDTFSLKKSQFKLQADTNSIKKFFDSKDDFMGKWIYFDLKDTLKLKVIHHVMASVDCGTFETASITIGTTQTGDTIRVLELCNTKKNFSKDDIIIVVPAQRPEFQTTHTRVFIQSTQGVLRPGPYDIEVLNTTYGRIEKE
jgi:hypothetical protein